MFIAGNSLWGLVVQSDAITWAILLILLGMSVICWAIALQRIWVMRRLVQDVESVRLRVEKISLFTGLEQLLIQGNLGTGQKLLGAAHQLTRRYGERLHAASYEGRYDDLLLIRDELDSTVIELVADADAYIVALKMTAEVAPLLGLLGTIWGLIHSFMRISSERNADIVTVAPGIAEALVTTLMGLLVAIPALLFFHVAHRYIQAYEQKLYLIAAQCENLARKHFMPGGVSL